MVKNPPAMQETRVPSMGQEDRLEKGQATTAVFLGFPGRSDNKEYACSVGGLGSIHGLGRSPGGGNGNPLQYSGLQNSMDRGAWQATVHGVAKSQAGLSDFHFTL